MLCVPCVGDLRHSLLSAMSIRLLSSIKNVHHDHSFFIRIYFEVSGLARFLLPVNFPYITGPLLACGAIRGIMKLLLMVLFETETL